MKTPMDERNEILDKLTDVAQNPGVRLKTYLAEGRKAVGVFPYYVPEELVYAAGFVPFGIWGAQGTVREADRYFPAFYCTIARMGLELALRGTLDGLSAVIMPSVCDTLRPFTQNFKAAKPDIPLIFLAHPQNRREAFGIAYAVSEYRRVKAELEDLAGKSVADAAILDAIRVYNESRSARREFVRLAGAHPQTISPSRRAAVLKSAYFMDKAEHTALLSRLNAALRALPPEDRAGVRIVTSGIIADSENLLRLFEKHGIAIVADDVAHESRSFRTDAPYTPGACPLELLARQFAAQGDDSLLYEPDLSHRGRHLADLVKSSGAQGVVFLMMQFCDPEELDYPNVKRALDEAGVPSVAVGYDHRMQDFGQAGTLIEAFADMLKASPHNY
ncbi:MAG: 2-hydroxyacyl-CoA dehydratase family protein [Clostridiales Family XIII bacterium]|jgi:bcr-type benzoyl-CoA reductase subunit C|nr:2-hydroxyacyl-CoA dehydratase family protein [Clostridiales Family XIII bacterium]